MTTRGYSSGRTDRPLESQRRTPKVCHVDFSVFRTHPGRLIGGPRLTVMPDGSLSLHSTSSPNRQWSERYAANTSSSLFTQTGPSANKALEATVISASPSAFGTCHGRCLLRAFSRASSLASLTLSPPRLTADVRLEEPLSPVRRGRKVFQ